MLTSDEADLTLPSVIASLASRYGAVEPVLTIIFHPDTARIGQRAVVKRTPTNSPWILGRRSPLFGGADAPVPLALDDPHISRRALQFTVHSNRVTIERIESSSRCRVGRSELSDTVELNLEQLRTGVPLLLGHSIVLLLRLGYATPGDRAGHCAGHPLHGHSGTMARIRKALEQAAGSDLDVLIRGETGTGKELAASVIHDASSRAQSPMVRVNMAAIPGDLAAAALFGNVRGAFTGADHTLPGYFAQAEGGTLFLDEIGDTAEQVQPQLLRVLEQREVQVVGGRIRRVDVRVISATDANLDHDASAFKAALRHRLGACEIVLPPLREHPEDIGELLLFFLRQCARESKQAVRLVQIDSPAVEIAAWALIFFTFVAYRWPGNVRELRNCAQQVFLDSAQQPVMSDRLREMMSADATSKGSSAVRQPLRKLQDVDDDTFEQAMLANACEVQRVACYLGVSRAAVYRRIEASPRYRLASAVPDAELGQLMAAHDGDADTVARELRVSAKSLRKQLRKLHAR
jgi:two-component system nitrogen regulation response regulator GlnG